MNFKVGDTIQVDAKCNDTCVVCDTLYSRIGKISSINQINTIAFVDFTLCSMRFGFLQLKLIKGVENAAMHNLLKGF